MNRPPYRAAAGIVVAAMMLSFTTASAAWIRDGRLAGSPALTSEAPAAISDDSGGMFLAWISTEVPGLGTLRAQRIDAHGNPQWGGNGIVVAPSAGSQYQLALAGDGAGGAVVVWLETGGANARAQRLNAAGQSLWTTGGVALTSATTTGSQLTVLGDGGGGAIAAWRDGSGAVRVQFVSAIGSVLVTPSGALIEAVSQYPRLVSDGAGGVIVTYVNSSTSLRARRVLANGSVTWPTGGVALGVPYSGEGMYDVVSDAAGGAIVAWSAGDLRAQRLDGSGNLQWAPSGVQVCPDPNGESRPRLIADGRGGAFVVWEDGRSGDSDLYAQRLQATGNLTWPTAGVDVAAGMDYQAYPAACSDGAGGVFVIWRDYPSGAPGDIRAQRFDSTGQMFWDTSGASVCGAFGDQWDPVCVPAGDGAMLASWIDYREGVGEIRAQRIDGRGYWGQPAPVIAAARDIPGDQGGYVLVSWDASALEFPPDLIVTSYSLWRSLPVGAKVRDADARPHRDAPWAATEATGRQTLWRQDIEGTTHYWEQVATQTARYLEGYAKPLPTYFDSTAATPQAHWFQIVAHTYDPQLFWISGAVSASSVDNLAPAPPALVLARASYEPQGLSLRWRRNNEPDLAGYEVHRGSSPVFVPGPATLVAAGGDTSLFDPDWNAQTSHYKLYAIDSHANRSEVVLVTPESVSASDGQTPAALVFLAQNRPNPFNPSTTIDFNLRRPADVLLAVYDAAGRLVRRLTAGPHAAGRHTIRWDGSTEDGGVAASGVYFCRLVADGTVSVRKMTLSK